MPLAHSLAPVLSGDEWNAARLHFAANGRDYSATAEAFGIRPDTLRKKAVRAGWLLEREAEKLRIQEVERAKEQAISDAFRKTEESLSTIADEGALAGVRAGRAAMNGLLDDNGKLTIKLSNAQDAKSMFDLMWKAAGRDKPETQVNVSLWAGLAGGEVSAAPVMEAEVIETDDEE